MFVLFAAGFAVCYWAEAHPHPLIHGAVQTRTATAPGGNMEGKETRFGIADSALFATITTDEQYERAKQTTEPMVIAKMSTHPYLRAYLAGVFIPTLLLPVILAGFIVARLVIGVPFPI